MWAASYTWNLCNISWWEIVSTSHTCATLGFSQGCVWGNGGQLEHRKFWLSIKKKLLPWGWSETGPGPLRDRVISVLGDIKTWLDKAWSNLLWWDLVWAEGQTHRVLRFFPTYLVLWGLSAELSCARWFGSGCTIVFVTELNFPLLFSSMQILIQMDRTTQRLEPWKIAVIVVAVIIGLALIIGLLTFYLCHGKHTTLLWQDFWNMLCFTWYCSLTWWFRYKIHPGIESTCEEILDCTQVLNWLENLQECLKCHLLEVGISVLSIFLFLVLPWCQGVVEAREWCL